MGVRGAVMMIVTVIVVMIVMMIVPMPVFARTMPG